MIETLLVLFGITGAIVVWRTRLGHDARRSRRVLRKTRVTRIADLEDGKLACIVGRVEIDGAPIEALITRRLCVAFDTTTSTSDELTVSTSVMRRVVPFFVTDATGRVRIDAPQIALCNKPIARADNYQERIIEDGDTIRIVGSVSLEPTDLPTTDHLFRQSAFKARLTGTSKFPLLADVERVVNRRA